MDNAFIGYSTNVDEAIFKPIAVPEKIDGLVDKVGYSELDKLVPKIEIMTQAEYDALPVKVETTIYIIKE